MPEENKSTDLDGPLPFFDRGLDAARSFINKLVTPSVEELGLLFRDKIVFWRFKNQVAILTKAKDICEKHNITTKAISPKILCPYLESASLESDDVLQDKWAILFVNLIDSKKNMQNHVLPFILSQLSIGELKSLEATFSNLTLRRNRLQIELDLHIGNKCNELEKMNAQLEAMKEEVNTQRLIKRDLTVSHELLDKIRSKTDDIKRFTKKETFLKKQIEMPEELIAVDLEDFEIANMIRLGLVRARLTVNGNRHVRYSDETEDGFYNSLSSGVTTAEDFVLTELGALFVLACQKV